jgi:hypothetical protein
MESKGDKREIRKKRSPLGRADHERMKSRAATSNVLRILTDFNQHAQDSQPVTLNPALSKS